MAKRPDPILHSPAHTVVWKRRRIEEGIPDLWVLPDIWRAHVRPLLSIVDRALLRRVNQHFFNMDNGFALSADLFAPRVGVPITHPLITALVYAFERDFGLSSLTKGWQLLFASKIERPCLRLYVKGEGDGTWWILRFFIGQDSQREWQLGTFSSTAGADGYYSYVLFPDANKMHKATLDRILISGQVIARSELAADLHPFPLPYGNNPSMRFHHWTNDKRRITPTTDPYHWPADDVV
jgi:hypothetical protein